MLSSVTPDGLSARAACSSMPSSLPVACQEQLRDAEAEVQTHSHPYLMNA